MSQEMYTIKKFNKGETLRSIEAGRLVTGWAALSTCFAIVAPNGLVNLVTSALKGQKFPEIYGLKSAAQQQADWYNKQAN